MNKIRESKFWNKLWDQYYLAPSVAFCRVPELEYASLLDVTVPTLDHCCGDGIFANLAWNNTKIAAGCDIRVDSIEQAKRKNIYKRVDVCDVSKKMPYPDKTFKLVFNNSALEHILDLSGTLSEVSRVLSRNGIFAFNVLNHRYFKWWPLSKKSEREYKDWQPVYHALSFKEWEKQLNHAGMEVVSVNGYFDRESSSILAKLDYYFSGYYIRRKTNLFIIKYLLLKSNQFNLWKKRLENLTWKTDPDSGAGYSINARKK